MMLETVRHKNHVVSEEDAQDYLDSQCTTTVLKVEFSRINRKVELVELEEDEYLCIVQHSSELSIYTKNTVEDTDDLDKPVSRSVRSICVHSSTDYVVTENKLDVEIDIEQDFENCDMY